MRGNSLPILVSGGAGFIGANLVHHLVKKYPVHIIVRQNTSLWRLEKILKRIKIHPVDLLDKNRLKQLVTKIKPRTIYHCASYGNYSFQKDADSIISTNIIGTYNLLSICARTGFDSFINSGTSSEYGIKKRPIKESEILEPASFYAASKSAATLLSQVFANLKSLPIVTLRLFSVYGPFEEKSRFIPTIIKNLFENKPIKLTSQLARRDFIFVDDVIRAFDFASSHAKKLRGEIINIGTGKQFTNQEVVKVLFKITGKRVPLLKGEYQNRIWDTPFWVADRSKAKRFHWSPRYSLEIGLRKTLSWYKKNKTLYAD